MTDRPGTVTAFWSHALLDYVIHTIGWKSLAFAHTHKTLKDTRRPSRAMKKMEREAKK